MILLAFAASIVRVEVPSFTPEGGTVGTSVTITTTTSNAVLFYRLSNTGSEPSHTGATPDTGSVSINASSGAVLVPTGKFLSAIAYVEGLPDSYAMLAYYGPDE